MAEVTVELENMDELLKQINQIRRKMKRKVLRKPLKEAAKVLVEEARSLAPVSKKPHVRYQKVGFIKKKRAPKGYGRPIAVYYPGNLKRSIQVMLFRKSADVFVGYRLARYPNTKGTFKGRRVDGYYAYWVEKRTPIMRRAVETSRNRLAAEVVKQLRIFVDAIVLG